jgi:hypothetical protein
MKWVVPPARKTPYLHVWRLPLPPHVDAGRNRRHARWTPPDSKG